MKNPTTGRTKPVDDDVPNENLDKASYGVIDAPTPEVEHTKVVYPSNEPLQKS